MFAILEPEISPVAPLETTAAFAAPPLNLPRRERERSVKNLPAPATSRSAPISTKR